MIIQRIILSLQTTGEFATNQIDIYTIIGVHDNVDRVFTDEKFTILNMPWKTFQMQTGIDIWDLWPDLQVKEKTFSPKIFLRILFRTCRKNGHLQTLVSTPSYILITYHH